MKSPLISSPTLVKEWMDYQHNKAEHPELYGLISTGLRSVDAVLEGGVEPGQYVLVGGPPKGGKTTLMVCIAKAFGQQKIPFAWFGAEMNTLQTGSMLFSNVAGIERSKIRGVNLSPIDWDNLETAGEKISDYPGYWNYGFATVEDMIFAMDQIEKDTGVYFKAVFVDYIQLMEAPQIKGNRVDQITYISRSLKRRSIRVDHPMVTFAAAQLRRENVRQRLYDISSWFGAGSLERDMDIGMIIHDAQDPATGETLDNVKDVEIVGSRETDIGSIRVQYNGKLARIRDNIVTNSFDMQ